MRKALYTLGVFALSAGALLAQAPGPLTVEQRLEIIRTGKNHPGQIQTLRVGGNGTIAGTLAVTGALTPAGGLTIIGGAYTGVLNIASTTLTFVVNGAITNVLDADITTP